MKNKEEIIIFGRSPQINEIQDIPGLQERYYNIGINWFPVKFPNVDYWFFIDDNNINGLLSWDNGQTFITDVKYKDILEQNNVKYEAYKLLRGEINKEKTNWLGYAGLTVSFALNWCLVNGFKTVYLAGCEHKREWSYFDTDKKYTMPEHRLKEINEYIERIKEYINVLPITSIM